jgi:hypothetical protein
MLQTWNFKCNDLFLYSMESKHHNRISKEEVIMYQITLGAMNTQEIIVPKSSCSRRV